jgi:hypothetical protein
MIDRRFFDISTLTPASVFANMGFYFIPTMQDL